MRYVPYVLLLAALILGACQPIVAEPANVAPEQDADALEAAQEEA